MRSRKLYSVGAVSVLVVLASVTGVAFTAGPGANPDVSSASNADTGAVLAQQNGSAGTTDEMEPNDDRANATRISTGEAIAGEAGARENGTDIDWYAFNLSAGEAFNVNHGGPAAITLYGPDGEQLQTEGASTPDTFVDGGIANETGTYYVRFDGISYTFDVQTASPDSFEPNDDRESAASIESGESVNVTLFEGEQDWYALELADGQNLSAVVERMSGAADPAQNVRIDLFAPNGSPVGEGFDPGDDQFSNAPLNQTDVSGGGAARTTVGQRLTADHDGTYYVRVSPVEGLSGFVDYSLTTTVSGGDQPTTGEPTTDDESADRSAADIVRNATEAYDEIEDFNATRVSSSAVSNGTTTETTNTTQKVSVKRPDKVRIETLAPESQDGNVIVSNGSVTTIYDAANNTVRTLNTSDSTMGAMNGSGFFGSIERTLTESNVSYDGTATVAGEETYVLSVEPNTTGTNATLGATGNQTYYLSQESYFPVKRVSESSFTYDNQTTTTRSVTTFRDLRVNVGIPDSVFTFEAPDDAERLGGLLPNVATYESVEAVQRNTNVTICEPSDLSEGYTFENGTVATLEDNTSVSLRYTNGSGDPLNHSLSVRVSTREPAESGNATYGQNVTVDGRAATYVNISGQGTLTFSTEDLQYSISGPLSKAELVSVAESIDCGPTSDEPASNRTDSGTNESTAYYQVDFVAGEPIENLRGAEGTYSNGELIRFAHGSSDEPVMRRSEGEFTTNDTLADRIESHNITVDNGTATTTFTVSEGESVTLSLVSYTKPGPGWSPETEHRQQFVDSETRTFESGTHTLTVDLPTADD